MAREPKAQSYGQFVVRLLTVAGLVVAGAALWSLSSLVLLVFASVLVAVLLRAISDPLGRIARLPQTWALTATVLSFVLLLSIGSAFFGAAVVKQFSGLAARLPDSLRTLEMQLRQLGVSPATLEWIRDALSDPDIGPLTQMAASGANAMGSVLLALVGGVYLAAQPDLYLKGFLALFPPRTCARMRTSAEDTGEALRHWIVGQLIIMVIVGLLTGTGAYLIGLPSWAALGLIAGLLEFIPYVGPILTGVPAVLLALSLGWEEVAWVLLLIFAVQQLEGVIITPLVQQRAVSLPPALTLFSLFAMGILFGVPGVFLAAPLTLVLYVGARDIYIPLIKGYARPGSANPDDQNGGE